MLKTWITGTKDFTDQGLAPSEWTNDNVTIVDGGKLGKCMYFNGTSSRLSTTGYTLNNKWSWACWVKEDPSVTAWQLVLMLNTSGSDADSQTALWLKANEHRFEVCNNAKYNSTIQYTQGQWNHYAMSFDGTTTKAYLNGSQVATFTSSTIFSKTNLTIGAMGTNANGGHVSASYYLKGYINDLRIWDDEVISPLQVKRLSQGLILHYCLDNNGAGGENLLGNTYDFSNIYNSNTGTQTIITDSNDGIYLKSHPSSVDWSNIVFKPFFLASNISGKTITVSCDIRAYDLPSTNTSNYVYLTLQAYDTSTTNTRAGNRDYGIPSDFLKEGEWVRISYQRVVNFDDWAVGSGYTINNFNYISLALFNHSGKRIDFRKAKVEIGDHPTPWCPNSSDTLYTTLGYNDNIEYDTSGFGNNGTRVGDFSWSTDTPRYLVSTQFSGSQYIRLPLTCGTISEAVTIACWGYEDNWNTSSAERLIGAALGSSGWCIGDYGSENTLFAFYANGSYNSTSGFKQLSSGWHHFVMTFDELNLICYVDGEQVSKKTFSTKQVATGNYNIEIGRHYGGSYNFKGRMSDVRIYATALSPEDILSLYQTSAYIDSQGNTYASSYVEG